MSLATEQHCTSQTRSGTAPSGRAEPAPAHKVSPLDCTELTNIAVLHIAPDTLLAYAQKVSCLFDRHEFVAAMVDEVQLSTEKDRELLSYLFR